MDDRVVCVAAEEIRATEAAKRQCAENVASDAIDENRQTQAELRRPCRLLRPEIVQDGDAYGAFYPDLPRGGDPGHLQGWGETPDAAEKDFDANYYRKAHVAGEDVKL